MAKYKKTNILIKDEQGVLYRLLSLGNWKDARGEYYIKMMFPDLKDTPLETAEHNKRGDITKMDFMFGGIQEFSFHYRAGVSHFKDANSYIDSAKSKKSFVKFPAAFLLRFIIYRLDPFAIVSNSEITNDDFILPKTFDGRPRGLEFAISNTLQWAVQDENGKVVDTYKIPLEDKPIILAISDDIWTKPPVTNGFSAFEIFRYDDPTSSLRMKGWFGIALVRFKKFFRSLNPSWKRRFKLAKRN